MQESIDQSIEEDAAKKAAEDAHIEKRDLKNLRKESFIGMSVGASTLLGIWLFFSALSNYTGSSKLADLGIPIGTLLMAFGIATLETLFNLYEGAPYHTWGWLA